MRDTDLITDPTQAQASEILLGRYRVLETRATGGFGAVKICWDRRLMRRVAIKCMPLFAQNMPNVAQSTINEALSEARSCCMVSHPNIVTVHDFEVANGYAYLVMEYIDGLNLEELLQRVEGGSLTFEETAHVLDSIATALEYAHQNQVLHLDIKPANIMINSSGTVKLTDFGMASLASAAGYADSRGGTVGYMPPEQINGELVDERCDVFALSCVVWKALTSTNPFNAKTAEASLNKINKGPRPPLSKTYPTLVGPVEDTLKRGMSKDLSNRIINCTELADIIVPRLGNADIGQASLADLIRQATSDEEEVPEYLMDKQAVLEEYSWAPKLFKSTLSALCASFIIWHLCPAFGLTSTTYKLILTCLCGAAGFASSALGGGICIVMMSMSIIFRAQNYDVDHILYSVGAAAILLLILGFWWIKLGRKNPDNNIGLLLAFSTGYPYASVPFGIETLVAFDGALTCSLAFIVQSIFNQIIFPTTLNSNWYSIVEILTDIGVWIGMLSCFIACYLGCIINKKFAKTSPLIAQSTGLLVVLFAQILGDWVKSAGVWQIPDTTELLIAVTLFGLMGIITILIGPNRLGQEA